MAPNNRNRRIAVVGGGIAGLASAFRLRAETQAADRPAEITVFEQDKTCGGWTRTKRTKGFSLDHGPNGWLSNEPLTARLVGELDLTGELVRSDDAACHRFIYTRGKLQRLPDTPGKFLFNGLLRPWEKLRVLGEFVTARRKDDDDESVYDFGCRRLGRGFVGTMLDPMVSGIFAGDVRRLSLPAVFPKMRSMELDYGGLFKAMIAKKREAKRTGATGGGPSGPAGALTTLKGGVGQLTERLAELLASEVRIGRSVTGLTRDGDGFRVWSDGDKERFDAVVLAVPAHAAAEIVGEMAPPAAAALGAIESANTALVCHAYDADQLPVRLNGFGHLIPRRDNVRALGCLWTSCIFPHEAPSGQLLLRTILGGAHDPEILNLSDDELLATALDNTATTLGITAEPSHSWIFRHRRGISQYNLGHRDRLAAVDQLCDEVPGLAFVGASYRGVSLNRCIRDAYTIAPRVLRSFGIDLPPIPDNADAPVETEAGITAPSTAA